MLGILTALLVFLAGADGRMVGAAFAEQPVARSTDQQRMAAGGLCVMWEHDDPQLGCEVIPQLRQVLITHPDFATMTPKGMAVIGRCAPLDEMPYRIPGWEAIGAKLDGEQVIIMFRCPL